MISSSVFIFRSLFSSQRTIKQGLLYSLIWPIVSKGYDHMVNREKEYETGYKMTIIMLINLLTALVYVCIYIHACMLSHSVVSNSVTPWTVAHQAPLSMEFFRQEYWSGLPFPPPGDLPNPGIKPTSPVSPELADGFFTTEPPGKPVKTPTPNSSNFDQWLKASFPYLEVHLSGDWRAWN